MINMTTEFLKELSMEINSTKSSIISFNNIHAEL